jgi:hypothetical protein
MESLTIKQHQFLIWVNRNYEWLKIRGFEPSIQSYQHWLYEILMKHEYTEEDKFHINYTIKFIKAMGLTTYNRDWTWDKNGAELDWLCNVRSVGFIKMPNGGTTTGVINYQSKP